MHSIYLYTEIQQGRSKLLQTAIYIYIYHILDAPLQLHLQNLNARAIINESYFQQTFASNTRYGVLFQYFIYVKYARFGHTLFHDSDINYSMISADLRIYDC